MNKPTTTDVGIPIGRHETLTEVIARRLIHLVTDEDYQPGDRLPGEFELARQFQVGRGAVREALKSLAVVGLIRVERGKGTFVRERSDFLVRPISLGLQAQVEPQALAEARTLIEVELAGLAAKRANHEQLHALQDCLDRMARAREAGQTEEYLQADMDFHFGIANGAHSPILNQFLTLIRNLLRESIHSALTKPLTPVAYEDHQRILHAIRAHRAAAARKAMTEHLNRMARKQTLPH
jgi:GntR family transcriptional repressor for pyruvate dehydrogenase complex